jgi:hypothetical protein
MKARTAAANQLHSLIDTAPERVRAQLRDLTFKKNIALAARWRPTVSATPDGASRYALASVASPRHPDRRGRPALQNNPRRCRRPAHRGARRRLGHRRYNASADGHTLSLPDPPHDRPLGRCTDGVDALPPGLELGSRRANPSGSRHRLNSLSANDSGSPGS